MATHHRIVVVGTGFAGIGMAVRLKQAGYDDFVVLERAKDVGGTWRDNTYPGCRCDVPSHLYSFSFAPNPDWSSTFSPQPEIEAYLQKVTDGFAVRPHIRFDHAVQDAHWEDGHWRIHTNQGDLTADLLLSGMGPLAEPSYPKLKGIEDFEGEVFHSAQWNHDLDLSGRKVAVIGTGASAIQFVPAIQPEVEELHLFQRTPPWVMPRPDRKITKAEKRIYKRVSPGAEGRSGRHLLVPRVARPRFRQAARDDETRPEDRRTAPGPADPRPRAARQTDARLHPRLQARADLRRLLPGPRAAERRRGHRRDPRGHPDRDRHRGRREARGRHDHLRHRIPGHRPAGDGHAARPRRADPARGVAGRHGGTPRYCGQRLPQLLPADRARTPGSGTARWCS